LFLRVHSVLRFGERKGNVFLLSSLGHQPDHVRVHGLGQTSEGEQQNLDDEHDELGLDGLGAAEEDSVGATTELLHRPRSLEPRRANQCLGTRPVMRGANVFAAALSNV